MKKTKRLKHWVINIIMFLLVIGIINVIYFSYEIIMWKNDINKNSIIQNKIEQSIKINQNNDTNSENIYMIEFKQLKEQNSDTVAYLKVNNTNIAYVVVKGKNNNYYLNHNFNKEKNISGWIFSDYKNKFDESDKNIVIYGHNTRNGSMFGTLNKILKKDWYQNKDNHKIILITENGQYIYQVFSSYSIIPEDYYITTDFNNDVEFELFINEIKLRSVYNYETDVFKSDKIITLSSCIDNGNKRVVLHAKLIDKIS